MPLYSCEQCGAVDNTALTNYWAQVRHMTTILCSSCDPHIGKWHDEFPKQTMEQRGLVMRQDGSRICEPPGGWPRP